MKTNKHKILVVDDEKEICELIGDFLKKDYDVVYAHSGLEAVDLAKKKEPSLVILDILMPEVDGHMTCEYLRKNPRTENIPVLILTALKDTNTKVKAFDAGADDFLSKPFHPDELLARVHSKIRRWGNAGQKKASFAQVMVCGNLKLNPENKEVTVSSKEVKLTTFEFQLLSYFLQNRDKFKTRKEIVENLWKKPHPSVRALDPHILSLRKKLRHFDHQIVTVYGNGFILKKNK